MDFWDYEYLNIPINKEGILEIDSNCDDAWNNVLSVQLTKEDVKNINKLVNDFNSTFNIIIDIAEEERLLNMNLKKALFIARDHLEIAPDIAKPSIQKVIDAINKALEYNTFVEFDL